MLKFLKQDSSLFVKCSILGVCLLLNIFAIGTLLFGEHSISSWKKANTQLSFLKEDLTLVQKQNESLSTKIRLLQNNDDYIEQQIRQQLNYVKSSEVLYIFEENKEESFWLEDTNEG